MLSFIKMFCQICGDEFAWRATMPYAGIVCTKSCWKEYQWRKTLSILGKSYEKQPPQNKEKKSTK